MCVITEYHIRIIVKRVLVSPFPLTLNPAIFEFPVTVKFSAISSVTLTNLAKQSRRNYKFCVNQCCVDFASYNNGFIQRHTFSAKSAKFA